MPYIITTHQVKHTTKIKAHRAYHIERTFKIYRTLYKLKKDAKYTKDMENL